MVLHKAVLTIGGKEFHLEKNISISTGVRTGFLVGGSGSTLMSVVTSFLDDGNPLNASGEQRSGMFIDLGGGVRMVQIEAHSYEGNANPFGGSGGADPWTQADELVHAIETTQIDSRGTATLEYGEYSSGGKYGPIPVVIEEPTVQLDAERGQIAEFSLTCLKAADLTDIDFSDAISQPF
ncbi:hypothetical protein SAMN05421858_5050 [Haladaptatus litoreus]|uniref:Uncharacterized protein n=1 Tax=Haladaptatus litoreus TaxID=553468 RepID=A0A1N7FH33_9EURY|nr:hypothetical protein [Haladaptatus litoreus]SIR99662.1 hypothetical protein SAMN05421858_5050 [Haladaptatus litoreus]